MVIRMTKKSRRALIAPIALSMTIAMSACASDDSSSSGSSGTTTLASDAPTSGNGSPSEDNAAAGSDSAAGGSSDVASAGGSASESDTTAVGLAAISTAEGATGGVAYEIDDQDDDGTWEVDVRVGDSSVEVKISADGTQVLGQENDDLDDNDRAGLDAASITLSDAIQTAVDHAGGTLDDAELDDNDNNQYYWEVSVDTDQQDDIEVHVSVTGDIIEVDN